MDFDTPTLTTPDGTRAVIEATPDGGLVVRTRTAMGADAGANIPADVAREMFAPAAAAALLAQLTPAEPSE